MTLEIYRPFAHVQAFKFKQPLYFIVQDWINDEGSSFVNYFFIFFYFLFVVYIYLLEE